MFNLEKSNFIILVAFILLNEKVRKRRMRQLAIKMQAGPVKFDCINVCKIDILWLTTTLNYTDNVTDPHSLTYVQ